MEKSRFQTQENHHFNSLEKTGLVAIVFGTILSNPLLAVTGLAAVIYSHSRHYHSN